MDAVQMVSSAVLGIEMESVFIGGKVYHIKPPTIRGFVGAARFIKAGEGNTLKDILFSLDLEGASKALSWLIRGDESLAETFEDAPLAEVIDGLIKGFNMIDPKNFIRLSALLRNVQSLIAKPR